MNSQWVPPRIPQYFLARSEDDQTAVYSHTDTNDSNISNDPTRRTLLEVVDHNALNNPDRTFCIQQVRSKSGPEIISLDYRLLKVAVHLYARQIVHHLAASSTDSHLPIAILLESSVNVLINTLAVQSLHRPVVLLSTRQSAPAISSLLDETKAAAVIVSDDTRHIAQSAVQELLSLRDGIVQIVPSYELVSLRKSAHTETVRRDLFVRPQNFNDITANAVILHSSGTTGLPKAIRQSHRWTLGCCNIEDADSSLTQGILALTPAVYHGYGFLLSMRCLATGQVLSLPPASDKPLSGAEILEWLETCKADHFVTVPSVLEDLSKLNDNEGPRMLARLKYVAFGGSLMKDSLGERYANFGVRLSQLFGATETGFLSSFIYPGSEHDWRYFKLRQDIAVQVKHANCNEPDDGRRIFIVDVPGWSEPFEIRDDFRASATTPGYFKACGRLDDVIVLSHGQNVWPGAVENALTSSPLVKTAMAFGNGRPELGALVIPSQPVPAGGLRDFREAIFSLVQSISSSSREDIHWREVLIILPHDAELQTTDKGSINREETLRRYNTQIEEAYEKIACQTTRRTV